MAEEKKDAKKTPKVNDYSWLKSGLVVKVHQKIIETDAKGNKKERIQVFEGTVIARKHGSESGASITVRKISNGVGVEKIFSIFSPLIDKIEAVEKIKTRRAKLYYLRNYKKKLKKTKITTN